MKAFTDLNQSKRLAEILPLESADMRFEKVCFDRPPEKCWYVKLSPPFKSDDIIPCWSLVALLDVFPNSEQKSVDICHGGWKGEEYVSDWFCSYDNYEKNYFETTNSDNPIDACYEMIIKLHEKNLL